MPNAIAPIVPSCRNTKTTVIRQSIASTRPPQPNQPSVRSLRRWRKKSPAVGRGSLFKADLPAEDLVHRPEDQGGDKAASDRFGNVVGAQERHALRDQYAHEEDDDANCKRQEVWCDEVRHAVLLHSVVKPLYPIANTLLAPS